MGTHRVLGQAQFGEYRRGTLAPGTIVGTGKRGDRARMQRAQPATRVIHEVASDQVLFVAQPMRHGRVRQQQQARVLDAAAGQHVAMRAHLAALALQ